MGCRVLRWLGGLRDFCFSRFGLNVVLFARFGLVFCRWCLFSLFCLLDDCLVVVFGLVVLVFRLWFFGVYDIFGFVGLFSLWVCSFGLVICGLCD